MITSIVAIGVVFYPKIKERETLLKKHQELQSKISQITSELDQFKKREIAIQTNPNYLEKLARNKLGYSKADEIIYKFDSR